MYSKSYYKVAIIGLGYVGLPLAVEFGKKYNTIGFDINPNRVNELISCVDKTMEIDNVILKKLLNNGLFSNSSAFLLDKTLFSIISVTFNFSAILFNSITLEMNISTDCSLLYKVLAEIALPIS